MKKTGVIILAVLLVIAVVWFMPSIIPGGLGYQLKATMKQNLTGGAGGGVSVSLKEGDEGGEEGEGAKGEAEQVRKEAPAPGRTFAQANQAVRTGIQEVTSTGTTIFTSIRNLADSFTVAGLPIGTFLFGAIGLIMATGIGYVAVKVLVNLLESLGGFLKGKLFSFEALKWISVILAGVYVAVSGGNMYNTARIQGAAAILPELQKVAAVIGFVLLGVMWKKIISNIADVGLVEILLKVGATTVIAAINAATLADMRLANFVLGWFAKLPGVGGFASALMASQVTAQVTGPDLANAVVMAVTFAATLALLAG